MIATLQGHTYKLRDYQQALIQAIYHEWKYHRRVCLQLPTGAGKTIVFAVITAEFVTRGEPVLVLVYAEELALQAQAKLQEVTGQPVGIIKAGYPRNPTAQIQVASVQTLARMAIAIRPLAALLIVDEAHHSAADSYQNILEGYPEAYVLGVTATPQRLDGKGLDQFFDAMVQGPQVSELIQAGYLSPIRYFAAENLIDTKGIRTTCGDFSSSQLREAAVQISGAVVSTWGQFAPGKRTIVFCINIQHAVEVQGLYQAAGVRAGVLTGEMPAAERRETIRAFQSGKLQVLTNCGIVSEGFDVPGVEAVQILRPTKSVALYLQQVGRALRVAPGKEYAIILDHTQNWQLHGLPDEERAWSLSGAIERPRRNLQRTQSGEVEEVPEPREIEVDTSASLSEVRSQYRPLDRELLDRLEDLLTIANDRGYKPGWVAYRFLEFSPGLAELRHCAKALGYKPRWALRQWYNLQSQGVAE